jgi:hypothetical protein
MSAPTISQNYSGVILDLNKSPRLGISIEPGQTYYQTFLLPEELQRGVFPKEQRLPALSGFQILIGVKQNLSEIYEASAVEVNYVLEQYEFGSGWSPVTKGTLKGVPYGNSRVWIDVLFDNPIELSESQVPSENRNEAPTEFRLALSFPAAVEVLSYVTPNPYSHGEGYHSVPKITKAAKEAKVATQKSGREVRETEELHEREAWTKEEGESLITKQEREAKERVQKELRRVDETHEAEAREEWQEEVEGIMRIHGSFNFRLLALVADSGTDFLGDPYRSVAIVSEAQSGGANPNTGYWLSSPQPTQFAVVSHYSDVRPLPTTPTYGITNLIENPSFEYDLVGGLPALWVGAEGRELPEEEALPAEEIAAGEWRQPLHAVLFFSDSSATLRVNRFRGEWEELEVYSKGEGISIIETLEAKIQKQKEAREKREKEEREAREKWVKEEEATEITKKEREEKETKQKEEREHDEKVEAEELEAFEREGTITRTFISKINENRAQNPLGFEGETFWEEREGQFSAIKGFQYLEVVSKGGGGVELDEASEVPVKIGVPITLSFWIRTQSTSLPIEVLFGNDIVGEVTEELEATDEWVRHEVTLPPTETGTANVVIRVPWLHGTQVFFLDGVMVNNGNSAAKYIDGDVISCLWNGIKGRSSSVELQELESEENSVVIDSMLIDPMTSGVGMNVYYTNDLTGSEGEGEPSIEDWEQKLWTRVPQTYTTSGKTTIVLPAPIVAKFVKLEFTNLQPKPYTPGDYQRPTQYKLFPNWVSEVFLKLLSSPNFVVGNVGVVFDKLELMYQYYKKDLEQQPNSPMIKAAESGEAQDLADPQTLSLINQVINTYTQPPAAQAPQTLMGEAQKSASLKETNYPVEPNAAFNGPANFPVSSLDRTNIVIDQGTPVMFFYVTCRHAYKEQTGLFAENKAYYAGIKQLAFLRESYTTVADGNLYIETGADDVNTDRNDFVVEDGIWYTD